LKPPTPGIGEANPSLSAKAFIKKRQKPANSALAGFFIFVHHQKNSKKVILGVSDSEMEKSLGILFFLRKPRPFRPGP